MKKTYTEEDILAAAQYGFEYGSNSQNNSSKIKDNDILQWLTHHNNQIAKKQLIEDSFEQANYLLSIGFNKIFQSPKILSDEKDEPIDINKFDYIKRISEVHYLFYSFTHGLFTLGLKYNNLKGKFGGGYDEFKLVDIPVNARTLDKIKKIISIFIDKN